MAAKDVKRGTFVGRMVKRPESIGRVNALLWGVAWLIVCSMLGWHFRLIPISSFGFTASGYVSLAWVLIYNVIVWFLSCVLLFALAVLRKRKIGAFELFARLLYARWPVTLLLLPGMITSQRVAYSTFMRDPLLAFETNPVYATLLAAICVVILLWYLYWSFLAFRKAQQKRGVVTFVVFVVGFVLSYPLTMWTMKMLYGVLL